MDPLQTPLLVADGAPDAARNKSDFLASSIVPPINIHSAVYALTTAPAKAVAVSLNGTVICVVTAANELHTFTAASGRRKIEIMPPAVLGNASSIALNAAGDLLAVGRPTAVRQMPGSVDRENAGEVAFFTILSANPSVWTPQGSKNAVPPRLRDLAGDDGPENAHFGSRVCIGVRNEQINIESFVARFESAGTTTARIAARDSTPPAAPLGGTAPATPAQIQNEQENNKRLWAALQKERLAGKEFSLTSAQRTASAEKVTKLLAQLQASDAKLEGMIASASAARSEYSDGKTWYRASDIVAVSGRLINLLRDDGTEDVSLPLASGTFFTRDTLGQTGSLMIPSFSLLSGFSSLPDDPPGARIFDRVVHTAISANGKRVAICHGDRAFIIPFSSVPSFTSDQALFRPVVSSNHVWGPPALSHNGNVVAIPSCPLSPGEPARIVVYTENQVKYFDDTNRTASDIAQGLAAGGWAFGGLGQSEREFLLPVPNGVNAISRVVVSPDGARIAAHFPEAAQLIVYTIDEKIRVFDLDVYNGFGEATPAATFPGGALVADVDMQWVNNQQLAVASRSGVFTGAWIFGRQPKLVGSAATAAFQPVAKPLAPVLSPNALPSQNTAGLPPSTTIGGGRFTAPEEEGAGDPPAIKPASDRGGPPVTTIAAVIVVVAVVAVAAAGIGFGVWRWRKGHAQRTT